MIFENCNQQYSNYGFRTSSSLPSFTNCVANNNTYTGYEADTGYFVNCIAQDNTGYGFRIGGEDSSEFINCISVNNSGSGFIFGNSTASITNSVVIENGYSGLNATGDSDISIHNSIFFYNVGDELIGESGTSISINYSDIEDGSTYGSWATGNGNIDSDPFFVTLNTDLHLQEDSDCINAGDPATAYNDTDGTRNDMGAYGGPNGYW